MIADDEGNQFTWVPIGTINNKTGDTRGTTTTINLGRIEWNKTTGEPGENKQEITTVAQARAVTNANAVELKASTTDTGTDRFKELVSKETDEGTAALNLNEFLESSIENHGYYMARYEASKGEDNKVKSLQNASVWNRVIPGEASTASQQMYDNNNYYLTDLVNSFAWDTTIVFIDAYGYTPTTSGTYASKTYAAVNVGPNNAGQPSGTSETDSYDDNYCNIYDMSGNYQEFTTEYSNYKGPTFDYPAVKRGGSYASSTTAKTGTRQSSQISRKK